MKALIKHTQSGSGCDTRIILTSADTDLKKIGLSDSDLLAVSKARDREFTHCHLPASETDIIIVFAEKAAESPNNPEKLRIEGNKVAQLILTLRLKTVLVENSSDLKSSMLPFVEGLALGYYSFDKYFTKESEKKQDLTILTDDSLGAAKEIRELSGLVNAVFEARDLVNEPYSFLNATQFSKEFKRLGKKGGFDVEVFGINKIKSLKMGGILAVNAGSEDPPSLNILEWKPKKPVNSKPLVLVGKGVVYDTGGLSLKPTANSMDIMKCDMAGAAAVVGTLFALASNKVPCHVIALIPATDNWPGPKAVAPGDVITMHNGMTVEVMNTDAEGRLILADALSYASRYKPDIVVDLATLTGSAVRAIGSYGCVAMGTASEEDKKMLTDCGEECHERVALFPLWDEYGKELKSETADIKNIGNGNGGAITAAKFLEHFISYPWIHLDIAGPAFLNSPSDYRPKNGTGTGVRLIYKFIKKKYNI